MNIILKKIYFLLFSFAITSCIIGQKKLLKEIEKFSEKKSHPDSVLAKFQRENDFVVGYADYNNTWSRSVHYYLLVQKNKKWKAYLYLIRDFIRLDSSGKPLESFQEVKPLDIYKGKLDSILSALYQNKIWKLRCDETKDFINPCPKTLPWPTCWISDAGSKSSLIMTKNCYNASSFYAPTFYEYECCPGSDERKRFLSTVAPIESLFKRLLNK